MCMQRARQKWQKCERKRITQVVKKRKQDNERSKTWKVTVTEIICTLENCDLENRSRKERERRKQICTTNLFGVEL